jgi:hypothetical protein
MMKYFAYGSNLLPSRIQQRLGPIVSIGNAILIDHQLNFSKVLFGPLLDNPFMAWSTI